MKFKNVRIPFVRWYIRRRFNLPVHFTRHSIEIWMEFWKIVGEFDYYGELDTLCMFH